MITRRRLLVLIPAVAATLNLDAQTRFFSRRPKVEPRPQPFVFFGTDTTHPEAKGIYISRFNSATGQFSSPQLAAGNVRAAFLADNQVGARHVLYAANEGADERSSSIITYDLANSTGVLRPLGQTPAAGVGPCYLDVDTTGKSVYVANYAGGTVASFKVKPDGTLSAPIDRINTRDAAFGKHGPTDRQQTSHPHTSMISPDNRFLIVNDLGNDDILIFPIDADSAHLGKPHLVEARSPGAGPRHIAFHPNGRWAYGIDELSSTIDQYLWNEVHAAPTTGAEPMAILTNTAHSVSTIDANFHGVNTAAEIEIAPSGYFLYASNRGENSIAVFNINQANGSLTGVQRISCGGKTPRHFTLDPTGRFLICGNQDSDSVTVFSRNEGNGQLSGPIQTLPVPAPMYTLFI